MKQFRMIFVVLVVLIQFPLLSHAYLQTEESTPICNVNNSEYEYVQDDVNDVKQKQKPYAELKVTPIQSMCNIELRLKNVDNVQEQTYVLAANFLNSNDRLMTMRIIESGTIPDGETSRCFSEKVPDGCARVQVFVWESFVSMLPLCQSETAQFNETDGLLRMAVLSDIHVGADKTAYCGLDPTERMQLLVDSVNAENDKKPIDFVIVTGDIVADGDIFANMNDWINDFAVQLDMPIYYVRGNHDRFTPREWEEFTGSSLRYSFASDRFSFIVLDSYPNFNKVGNDQYKEIDDEEIEYIEQEIDNHEKKQAFVITHYLADNYTTSKIGQFAYERDDVPVLLYGHAHVFNNNPRENYYALATGSFFEPCYEPYPTFEQITGSTSRNLLGWRMIEENEDHTVETYEVQPANYYPYWEIDYPYTIQQRMKIIEPPADVKEDISVTASSRQDFNHIAQYSADNNPNTYWSANGDGEWIEYTFNEARKINIVELSIYNASSTRKAKFDIYVSEDGNEYKQVFSGKSTLSSQDFEPFIFPEQLVKSVKIVGHGNTINTWNTICEANFKLKELPSTGVSANASTENAANMPACTLDDNYNTYWNAKGDGEWIEYIFDDERTIDAVDISFYGASSTRKTKFDIYVSSDAEYYSKVFSGQSTGSDASLERFPITPQTVKSVKIVSHGNTVNTWIAINEVRFSKVE